MSSDQSASSPHQEINIRKNSKINTSIVAAYEQLEREFSKLGIEIKSSYNIEPAFGRHPFGIRNNEISKARKSQGH